jgi:hypothetical protein
MTHPLSNTNFPRDHILRPRAYRTNTIYNLHTSNTTQTTLIDLTTDDNPSTTLTNITTHQPQPLHNPTGVIKKNIAKTHTHIRSLDATCHLNTIPLTTTNTEKNTNPNPHDQTPKPSLARTSLTKSKPNTITKYIHTNNIKSTSRSPRLNTEQRLDLTRTNNSKSPFNPLHQYTRKPHPKDIHSATHNRYFGRPTYTKHHLADITSIDKQTILDNLSEDPHMLSHSTQNPHQSLVTTQYDNLHSTHALNHNDSRSHYSIYDTYNNTNRFSPLMDTDNISTDTTNQTPTTQTTPPPTHIHYHLNDNTFTTVNKKGKTITKPNTPETSFPNTNHNSSSNKHKPTKNPPPSPNTTHTIPTSLPPSTFTSQMQKHNQYLIPNGLKTN